MLRFAANISLPFIAPFITFTVVYIFLAIAVVYLMMRQVRLSAAPVNHHSKPNANAD